MINNLKKYLEGVVVSNKMNKTIVVKVTRIVKHKKYFKFVKRSSKYFVHDENNNCNIGDVIFFKEVAPISKRKNFIFCSFKRKVEVLE